MGLNAHAHLPIASALTAAEATNIQTECPERKHWSHNRAGGRCTCTWWGARPLNFSHWNLYMKIALWNQNARFFPKQGPYYHIRKLRPSKGKVTKKLPSKETKREEKNRMVLKKPCTLTATQTTQNTGKIKFPSHKKQNQNFDTYLAFGWLRAIFFSSISLSQVTMFIPAFAAYFIWEACLQGFVYIMFSGEMPRSCTNAISDWKTRASQSLTQSSAVSLLNFLDVL